jgi:hypothetical protein
MRLFHYVPFEPSDKLLVASWRRIVFDEKGDFNASVPHAAPLGPGSSAAGGALGLCLTGQADPLPHAVALDKVEGARLDLTWQEAACLY